MDTYNETKNVQISKLIGRLVTLGVGIALVAAGLLFAVSVAWADSKLSAQDKEFILAAAQGGMTEVTLGKLAAAKGTREDVKAFGQKMVTDHTAINSDLKTLASRKGVTLPDKLNAKHQGMVDKLAKLQGSQFDDAYVAAMIKDHKNDAKEFKAEAADTKDPDIKTFLDKSIPVVEAHLKHITAMKQ